MVGAIVIGVVVAIVAVAVGRFVWRLSRGTLDLEHGGSDGSQLEDAVRRRKPK